MQKSYQLTPVYGTWRILAQGSIPFVTPYRAKESLSLLYVLSLEVQDVVETLKSVEGEGAADAYKEACMRLPKYFQPKTNKVFERYKFREMKQGEKTVE